MISLALDCATDRCTVAATDGTRTAHRHLDGARSHATAVLQLLDAVLHELGATVADTGRLLTGDGPGSFTGLRVATSVAKAICWHRDVEWRVAPSLLLRAATIARPGDVILALSDALRGDVYAGCWRFTGTSVEPVNGSPRAMHPDALAEFGPITAVIGSIPEKVAAAVEMVTGCTVVQGEAALPDARQLFALADLSGGTTLVRDADGWEPEYGRPAEAQAVWERKHGRALPAAPGIAR